LFKLINAHSLGFPTSAISSRNASVGGGAEHLRARRATTRRQRKLAGGAKVLVGNKSYRRFLAAPGDDGFAIDPTKVEADAQFDGVFVLRTSLSMSALAVVLPGFEPASCPKEGLGPTDSMPYKDHRGPRRGPDAQADFLRRALLTAVAAASKTLRENVQPGLLLRPGARHRHPARPTGDTRGIPHPTSPSHCPTADINRSSSPVTCGSVRTAV
jgi:hypothetical protein